MVALCKIEKTISQREHKALFSLTLDLCPRMVFGRRFFTKNIGKLQRWHKGFFTNPELK